MKYTTRFNPTVNGPLHLGHIYTVLVNLEEARRSGGKFGVRFDDTQRSWNFNLGAEKVREFRDGMIDDLIWLDIPMDYLENQSEMMPKVERLLHEEFAYFPDREHFSITACAELAGCPHHFYPYTERMTAEKAIMDMLEGVTWLIRGMDLITEDALYRHFCAKFLMATPRTTYIPRLECGGEISKTFGKYRIEQFRKAGYDPEELVDRLAHDCLTAPGWTVDHIKPQPVLGRWAEEVIHGLPA
jgi:glutamyl/glutaminyl-tRNA synthetase